MSAPADEVRPRIDDRYWFDFSKSLLDTSIARRESAAEGLQKLVIWLWGIYTASAAVGFALSGKQLEFWPTLTIALGSGLLILVYWGTVWVQMPKVVAFDPRSPTEIQDAFLEIVSSKSKRLAATLFLSVVTAIMVSVGLVVAAVSKPSPSAVPAFRAVLGEAGGESILSVTSNVGKASFAELSVTPVSRGGQKGEPLVTRLAPLDDGLIQTSTRLKAKAEAAHVQLMWEDKSGMQVRLSKTIKRES